VKQGERYFIYLTKDATLTYTAETLCDDPDNTYPNQNYRDLDENSLQKKTTVKYGTEEFTDQCSSDTRIIEGYCATDGLSWNGYDCPDNAKCGDGACKKTPEEVCFDFKGTFEEKTQPLTFNGKAYQTIFNIDSDKNLQLVLWDTKEKKPFEEVPLLKTPFMPINEQKELIKGEMWVYAKDYKYIDYNKEKIQAKVCLGSKPFERDVLSVCKDESSFKKVCTEEKVKKCALQCELDQPWNLYTSYKDCVLGCIVEQEVNSPLKPFINLQHCYEDFKCGYEELTNNKCDQICSSNKCGNDGGKCSKPKADFSKVKGETVTLKKGMKYKLKNNLDLEVTKIKLIKFGESEGIVLGLDHFINGKRTSRHPATYGFEKKGDKFLPDWSENYGYRVRVNKFNSKDNSVEVTFYPLTGKLSSPVDLYKDCLNYRDFLSCYRFSAFDPIESEDEIKIETPNFVILGPKKIESYLKYVQDEVESCYKENKVALGVGLHDTEKFPVRVSLSHEADPRVNYDGFYLNVGKEAFNPKNQNNINGKCDDLLISHEIVHAIFKPDPTEIPEFPPALNEGLATYVANELLSNSPKDLKCGAKGYILGNYKEEPYVPLHKWGTIDFHPKDPNELSGFDLYWVSACFWNDLRNDHGEKKFKEVIKLMHGVKENTAFLEMLKNVGINSTKYQKKYGIDPNDPINFFFQARSNTIGPEQRWDGVYK